MTPTQEYRRKLLAAMARRRNELDLCESRLVYVKAYLEALQKALSIFPEEPAKQEDTPPNEKPTQTTEPLDG